MTRRMTVTDRTTDRPCAGEASPETQAALALFDELAQRGRRLRAAGYQPRRDPRPE
jgi:hypothetical protein